MDDDLVQILDKVPNWDASNSIRKFISSTIDRPLPDEMIKTLNADYVPSAEIEQYFTPPKMPKRLYKAISRMKSKCALRTEQTLFSAQTELFVIAKPLVASLIELKPLGTTVSGARELLSVTLQGQFSISLKISKARRDNIRFLFKESLAEVLYSYAPTHASLFGGKDFASQVEKSAKEAKLEFSWNKSKKSSFRNQGSQGFTGSKNSAKYYKRQGQNSNNNNKYTKKGNSGAKKSNYTKKGGQSKE